MQEIISKKAQAKIKFQLEELSLIYVHKNEWDYKRLLKDFNIKLIYKKLDQDDIDSLYEREKNTIYINVRLSQKLRELMFVKCILKALIANNYFKLLANEIPTQDYIELKKNDEYIQQLALSMLVRDKEMEAIMINAINDQWNFVQVIEYLCKNTPLSYVGSDMKMREFTKILSAKGYGKIIKKIKIELKFPPKCKKKTLTN